MKPKIVIPAVVAVAALGLGALFVAAPQPAKAIPVGAGGVYDVLYDQQDVTTSPTGTHRLDYSEGKHHAGECLEQPANPVERQFVTVVVPARNLTNPGNAPIGVQAVEHDQCGVLLRFFNKSNEPIGSSVLRITYTAASQIADPTP